MGFLDRFFGPPSKSAFAKKVMRALRAAGATESLRYDADEFRIVSDEGSITFLHNAYDGYCAAPRSARKEVVKRHIRAWFAPRREMPDEFEHARPDIMPVVRARAYFELTALRFQAEGNQHVAAPYQPLGEHLAVGLVYDMPDAMRSITQDDLDRWGETFYQALEAARDNLAKLPMTVLGPQNGPGGYLTGTCDNYDASGMIRLDVIRGLNCRGDYIAMVPNRNSLIIGGPDDPEGLRGMLKLAKKSLEQPRPITSLAFRLDGDDWVPWLHDRLASKIFEINPIHPKRVAQRASKQNHTALGLARRGEKAEYRGPRVSTRPGRDGRPPKPRRASMRREAGGRLTLLASLPPLFLLLMLRPGQNPISYHTLSL